MSSANDAFIGKGKVYLENLTRGGGLRRVGNVSALDFSIENESVEQRDYTGAGGNSAVISRPSTVAVAMTMLSMSARNIAMAIRGTIDELVAAPVSGESHTGNPGALIAFSKVPNPSETVTVTIDPGGTPVNAVAGTHYDRTDSGILLLDHVDVTPGVDISVDYTSLSGDVVEAMTSAGDEYRLVFEGLNEAKSKQRVVVEVHRMVWTPTSGMGFISDDFAELPLEGSVLSDPSITSAGKSQFFRVTYVDLP